MDRENGPDETDGHRIGQKVVYKGKTGFVLDVVSKSDDANDFGYAYLWVVWQDNTFDAPGKTARDLRRMRERGRSVGRAPPNVPRRHIKHWWSKVHGDSRNTSRTVDRDTDERRHKRRRVASGGA